MNSKFLQIVPVLPSSDITRDLEWYAQYTGFEKIFGDDRYVGLKREHLELHLQWHADTNEDPLLGGSVVRIFTSNVKALFDEFLERGTVTSDQLRLHTPWGTHEFGFRDPNQNGIFIVEDV